MTSASSDFSVPENRLRVYDVREIINTIADKDSVLELRPHFGVGMITAFIRVEGQPMGLIANDPAPSLAPLIAMAPIRLRFMQLCDAFDLPIVSLVDCPGIMVGRKLKTALAACKSGLCHLYQPYGSTVRIRVAQGLWAWSSGDDGGRF